MRRIFILALLLTSACNTQSGNGGIVSWKPVWMQDQSWQVGGEFAAPDGSKSCVVTSGEIKIIMTSFKEKTTQEVSTTLPMDPGNFYRIIVKNHTYETQSSSFGAKDSAAIVKDFLNATTIYTELHVPEGAENKGWRNNTNKISLDDFAAQHQACKDFIGTK